MPEPLRVGLIVNPVAGIGGPAALRGSDTAALQHEAASRGAASAAQQRARRALVACAPVHDRMTVFSWGGAMGETAVRGLALATRILGVATGATTGDDTRRAVTRLAATGIDVLPAIPPEQPVLGIPAGVKMRSGVFTVTPEDAGAVIVRLVEGGLVAADIAEVQDIDDLVPRTYGELRVPRVGGYLQRVKSGGREVEALVLTEIAAWIAEQLVHRSGTAVIGPGSTTMAIKQQLGIDGTLLGVDVIEAGRMKARDADARTLESIVAAQMMLVISFTREQGFVRPRQPAVVRHACYHRIG